jgi:lysyl-tRNA synthetase class I
LARVHRFYVERRFGDDHHLDEYIVQELRREGHEATSGPLTMKPDGVDAIVTYADRWAWDFKNYLVELTLEVRNARTDQVLTTGRSYQPSITAKTPPQVIREILTPLFGPGAARSKS